MPENTDGPDPATADVPMLGYEPEDEWNRPRGLYTGTDRKFMWGVETYEDSPVARSNRRKQVRERTHHGLRDLFYLSLIEDEQQEKLLGELAEDADEGELRDAVAALVTFLYRNLDGPERWLQEAVASGVTNALLDEVGPGTYRYPEVDVEIESRVGPNLDALERKLADRPYALNNREIGILVRSGRLDPEDVDDLREDREDDPTMGTAGPR